MTPRDRQSEDVVRASQAITLYGGPASSVFKQQSEAADALRRFAVEELHGRYMGRPRGQIEFYRPVFDKVCNCLRLQTSLTYVFPDFAWATT